MHRTCVDRTRSASDEGGDFMHGTCVGRSASEEGTLCTGRVWTDVRLVREGTLCTGLSEQTCVW